MRNKWIYAVGLSCLAIAGAASAADVDSGEAQRQALAVTVYSHGMALIEDQRTANLSKGNNTLRVLSISPNLVPETLRLDTNKPFQLIEQGLLPANLNRLELLKAYEGKTLKWIKTHPTTGEEVRRDVHIISASPHLIVRIDGQIETSLPGRIVFPEIPDRLRAKPVFKIVGVADEHAETTLNIQYLAHGLSWRADHVASFDEKSQRLKLQTRATLVNNSGLDLVNAHMQMVAGQVNQVTRQRVRQAAPRLMKSEAMAMADAGAAAPPSRQNLDGYHLYSLNRPIDLAQGQTKQVPLLPTRYLPAKRMLVSVHQPNIYGRSASVRPSHPQIQIELENDKSTGAAEPLPGGTLRLYGKDNQGRSQFLGENRLSHLPVGESAHLTTGQAFDVTVRRKQIDFKREVMGRNTFEVAFEIHIKNGSDKPETIVVKENLNGDWKFTDSNTSFKRNGTQAIWTVVVPAGGDTKTTYRVRVRR